MSSGLCRRFVRTKSTGWSGSKAGPAAARIRANACRRLVRGGTKQNRNGFEVVIDME